MQSLHDTEWTGWLSQNHDSVQYSNFQDGKEVMLWIWAWCVTEMVDLQATAPASLRETLVRQGSFKRLCYDGLSATPYVMKFPLPWIMLLSANHGFTPRRSIPYPS